MTTITFIHPDGRSQCIDANTGESAMQLAVTHGIAEIVAECGGNAMCATCHVYVDDRWIDRLPAMTEEQDALLDGTASRSAADQPAVLPDQGCAGTRWSRAPLAGTTGLMETRL
jgi:2Fe-2S ferredoxin